MVPLLKKLHGKKIGSAAPQKKIHGKLFESGPSQKFSTANFFSTGNFFFHGFVVFRECSGLPGPSLGLKFESGVAPIHSPDGIPQASTPSKSNRDAPMVPRELSKSSRGLAGIPRFLWFAQFTPGHRCWTWFIIFKRNDVHGFSVFLEGRCRKKKRLF